MLKYICKIYTLTYRDARHQQCHTFSSSSYQATYLSVSPHRSSGTTQGKCNWSKMVLPCCITWLEIHCLHRFAFCHPTVTRVRARVGAQRGFSTLAPEQGIPHENKLLDLLFFFIFSLKEPKSPSSSLQSFEYIIISNVMVFLTDAGRANL